MVVFRPFLNQSLTTEMDPPDGGSVTVSSPSIQVPAGRRNYADIMLKIDKLEKTGGLADLYLYVDESMNGIGWSGTEIAAAVGAVTENHQHMLTMPFVRFRAILELTGGVSGDVAFTTFDVVANLLRS